MVATGPVPEAEQDSQSDRDALAVGLSERCPTAGHEVRSAARWGSRDALHRAPTHTVATHFAEALGLAVGGAAECDRGLARRESAAAGEGMMPPE